MKDKLLNLEELKNFKAKKKFTYCGLCANNCQLTIHNFEQRRYVTGNRCDKPVRKKLDKNLPNMVAYKYNRLFDYTPLTIKEAKRGEIGIPRVLNMYEHYPFWFTFFTALNYQVIISPSSSKKIYELGMDTIPSETLCYPAKLANGHITKLIEMGIKRIFYPSILGEKISGNTSTNFSCPVVVSYPEVIANNMDDLSKIDFIHPFLNLKDHKSASVTVLNFAKKVLKISNKEAQLAFNKAWEELENYQEDIKIEGKKVIKTAKEMGKRGIVLAGRPYHIDPEINHGIDTLITSNGMIVLTEDAVSEIHESSMNLRVIDQWVYHSQLYEAAHFVGQDGNFDLIQLNSFGCGIDAITTDQVKEILEHHNKVYTLLKIDEGSNLGAAKIRIRSLKAAVEERTLKNLEINNKSYDYKPIKIDGKIKDYTILAPQMSPIHFELIEHAFIEEGYKFAVLPAVDKDAIEIALKYVNNDACYPALVVIGQMLKALDNYNLDQDKVALLITQTGGGCRASNYIALLRRALVHAGFPNIPVISLNAGNIVDENSMQVSNALIKKGILGLLYGDLFLRVIHRMRPYEINKGQTNSIHKKWIPIVKTNIINGKVFEFRKNVEKIIKDFDNIEIDEQLQLPRVGIVGEILVKYHPTANNELVKVIEENGGEAVIPDMYDFFLYGIKNTSFNSSIIEPSLYKKVKSEMIIMIGEFLRSPMIKQLNKSKHFDSIHKINTTSTNAKEFVSLGNQTGEGWFLTGEMINLIQDGVTNIICTQPFGCLPNHITGKGMFKKIRESFDDVNLVAIDYDPGASEVNQISRIKLMISVAKKYLEKEC